MNTSFDIAKLHAQRTERAFESWLREPAVCLLVSMIPAAQPPEVVRTLLREAFTTGSHVGVGFVLHELSEHVARKDQERGE